METIEQNINYILKSNSSSNFQEDKEERSRRNLLFARSRPLYRSPRYLSKQKAPKPQTNTSTNIVNINNNKRIIPLPTIKPLDNSSKIINSIQSTSSYHSSTIDTNALNKNYLSNSNLNVKNNQKGNRTNTKPLVTSSSSSSYTRRNHGPQTTIITSSKALKIIPHPQTQTHTQNGIIKEQFLYQSLIIIHSITILFLK